MNDDIKDRIIVHLAQAKHCLKTHEDRELYLRLKNGTTTDEDKACLEWAMKLLREAGL